MTKNATISDLTQTACPHCSVVQAPGARFCGDCGGELPTGLAMLLPAPRQSTESPPADADELPAAVPASTVLPVVAAPKSRRLGGRAGQITAGALAVVFISGVTVVALDDHRTHQRLSASRSAYADSQHRLATTKTELAKTAAQLTSTTADLTSAESTLASTKDSLTTAQKTLAAKEQDLVGVRNNLTQVKNSVTVQASQIETLKSCLNGVSIALNDVAYGDYSAAIAALNAVEVSCDAAYELF